MMSCWSVPLSEMQQRQSKITFSCKMDILRNTMEACHRQSSVNPGLPTASFIVPEYIMKQSQQ